jgi:hypothetical protein
MGPVFGARQETSLMDRKPRTFFALTLGLVLGCADPESIVSELRQSEPSAHADRGLAIARQDEKLADDVERVLAERWPAVAASLREAADPLVSTEQVLRERGVPDPEAGLPDGVFSASALRRSYFAALMVGWGTERGALSVVARVEAQRLASLGAARAELPDVDQRLVLDRLERAASDRLQGLCRRLSALGAGCSEAALGRGISEKTPRSPNS